MSPCYVCLFKLVIYSDSMESCCQFLCRYVLSMEDPMPESIHLLPTLVTADVWIG